MKKVLILIMILLLVLLCYNVAANGYQIANLKILSLKNIQQQNEALDATIAKAEQLKSVEYPAKISELNSSSKTLLSNKKTYEELATYSSEQDVLNAKQAERYDVEVLWIRIGNHAKKNGVVPKLEILSSSNNTTGANDLRITATGRYIGLTDFIRDIEDDAKLGFSIENFELVPVHAGDGSNLQATFKIKDIFINPNTTTTNSSVVPAEDNAKSADGNEKSANTTEETNTTP